MKHRRKDPPVFFGEWLQRRRRVLDLTQEELAQRASCSVHALRKIETGERRPSKQLAGLIAAALGIPPQDQPTFIRVARGELALERLQPPSLAPAARPAQVPKPVSPLVDLPAVPTPLIGREAELAALGDLLHDPHCRLLTLVGPGGIGKTRLAIEVATQHPGIFPGGIHFVPLASLSSPAFLVPAIAAALGLTFQGQLEPRTQLLDYLRPRQALLVLDNLEHLLEGVGLFAEILEASPGVKLLATSRERLNLQGEWVFEIHGLPVPPTAQVERAGEYSAVALFVHNAQRLQAGFQLRPEDLSAIVRICQVVDGMPLGIELAAAWVPVLTCREIAHEIGRNLDLLTSTMRDLPERHRSMQAVFDHSWELLSAEEQRVFRQLSVFRGSFGRHAMESVAGASLPLLSSLLDKNLLRRAETFRRKDTLAQRYELHELTRQYAQARLSQAGEATAAQDRHLDFYLHLAEEAGSELEGIQQVDWFERLEVERDNLRAALVWAQQSANAASALRLCVALGQFWEVRGYYSEGRNWVEEALALPSSVPPLLRVRALKVAGRMAYEEWDLAAAQGYYETGLALSRELDDLSETASLLNNLGNVAWGRGDLDQAGDLYDQVLAIRREAGDQQGIANVLNNLGLVAMGLGHFERAVQFMDESAVLNRELGNHQAVANSLFNLGLVTVRMPDSAARAAGYFSAAVELARELGFRKILAYSLNNLAMLALHQGETAQSTALAQESLELCQMQEDWRGIFFSQLNLAHAALDRGDPPGAARILGGSLELLQGIGDDLYQAGLEELAWFLEALVHLAVAQGDADQAVQLAGLAAALRETPGVGPLPPTARVYYEATLAEARTQLDKAGVDAAWAAGQALPPEQAIPQALRLIRPPA